MTARTKSWCFVLGLAIAAWAQSATPANLSPGTIVKAELSTEIESANSQVGDQISATLSEDVKQGKTKLPKGTTINGHIVQVTPAKDNDSPSSITVLFNQAVTSKGQTYSLLAGVASVAKPSGTSSSPFSRGGGGGRGRGGYGRGGGGGYPSGGYPSSSPPVTSSTGAGTTSTPDIRFPADDASTGSILSAQRGDVWIYPQTKITLQIIAPPPPAH